MFYWFLLMVLFTLLLFILVCQIKNGKKKWNSNDFYCMSSKRNKAGENGQVSTMHLVKEPSTNIEINIYYKRFVTETTLKMWKVANWWQPLLKRTHETPQQVSEVNVDQLIVIWHLHWTRKKSKWFNKLVSQKLNENK